MYIYVYSFMYAHVYLCYSYPSNFVGCDGSMQLPTSIWEERPFSRYPKP